MKDFEKVKPTEGGESKENDYTTRLKIQLEDFRQKRFGQVDPNAMSLVVNTLEHEEIDVSKSAEQLTDDKALESLTYGHLETLTTRFDSFIKTHNKTLLELETTPAITHQHRSNQSRRPVRLCVGVSCKRRTCVAWSQKIKKKTADDWPNL